jgi:hypothetical protein
MRTYTKLSAPSRDAVPFTARFSTLIHLVGACEGDNRIMLAERGTGGRIVAACTSWAAAEAVDRLLNGWCETSWSAP